MSGRTVAVVLISVVAAVVGIVWTYWYPEKDEKEEQETPPSGAYSRSSYGSNKEESTDYHYSNLRNNHDHQKRRHPTKEYADHAVIRRMKQSGRYKNTDRLQSYYNHELKAWFVGNKKYNDSFVARSRHDDLSPNMIDAHGNQFLMY